MLATDQLKALRDQLIADLGDLKSADEAADWADPPDELVHTEVCLSADRRTKMPRKHHKPEEIVPKMRRVDVLTSQCRWPMPMRSGPSASLR